MNPINKRKRIGGNGLNRRHILPLFMALAAVCCCTYYVTNVRQVMTASTAALLPPVVPSSGSGSAFLGMAVPRGKAVALPSVRISAEESDKIQRKIYGGEGGEFRDI